MTVRVNALSAYSMRSGNLLFDDDFIKLIENTFIPCKMKRLVSDFKQMQNMVQLVSLHKLHGCKIVPPHIFSRNADLIIGNIVESPHFHAYTSIQLSQSPDNSALSISST